MLLNGVDIWGAFFQTIDFIIVPSNQIFESLITCTGVFLNSMNLF